MPCLACLADYQCQTENFLQKQGEGGVAQSISYRKSGSSKGFPEASSHKKRRQVVYGPKKVGVWISRALRALGLFFC